MSADIWVLGWAFGNLPSSHILYLLRTLVLTCHVLLAVKRNRSDLLEHRSKSERLIEMLAAATTEELLKNDDVCSICYKEMHPKETKITSYLIL